MNAGTVDLLLILGGNPVYTAPADLEFADALQKVPLRAHLGLYEDETAACVTGTSRRRISSRRGATFAPPTAPPRSCSR